MTIAVQSTHHTSHLDGLSSFFHPTTWKISVLARAIFCSQLYYFCGPSFGLMSAVVMLGIELVARKISQMKSVCFSHPVKIETPIIDAVVAATPIDSSEDKLVDFFKTSPNFSENPNFEKFIRNRIHLPSNSQISIDGNIMTIKLSEPATLRFDKDEPLTEEEFLKMNRHTETENLLRLSDKCFNPRPKNLPPLKMKNLYYMRSFGEIITALMLWHNQIPIGPEIVLKMDGNNMEFVKGGLMNISGISFEKGWDEELGLISITRTTLFMKITRHYFISDLSWILSKLK